MILATLLLAFSRFARAAIWSFCKIKGTQLTTRTGAYRAWLEWGRPSDALVATAVERTEALQNDVRKRLLESRCEQRKIDELAQQQRRERLRLSQQNRQQKGKGGGEKGTGNLGDGGDGKPPQHPVLSNGTDGGEAISATGANGPGIAAERTTGGSSHPALQSRLLRLGHNYGTSPDIEAGVGGST